MLTQDSLEEVFREARGYESRPLWTIMDKMVPAEPTPRAVPHLWTYKPLKALLDRAGELIRAEEAERRVLMLINPKLEPPCTTDTLFAGYQYILPGETAPAHRHSAFALRFIIEGSRAYTAVGGERVWMEPGDLILTPSWTFHDHGKEGQGPMVWLDGLDLPVVHFTRTNFKEEWPEAKTTSVDARPDSNLGYPWKETRPRLDAQPGPWAQVEYLQRIGGGPISKTIGAQAERLDAGQTTPRRRSTACQIYNIFEGRGVAQVGDVTLPFEKGDTFAVPSWYPFTIKNTSSGTAYLFAFNDRPLLQNIGLYREETSLQ
jgi:gentisate 1,2-dioxygenase